MCAGHGSIIHCKTKKQAMDLFLLGLPHGWDDPEDDSSQEDEKGGEKVLIRAPSMQEDWSVKKKKHR